MRWNSAGIQKQLANGRTENVLLPVKVPVLLAYWTVDLSKDGRVTFKPDIYDYDARVLQGLSQPVKLPALDLRLAEVPLVVTGQSKQ
ncbi:murein L,D-transpeptidase [compost metagenome]